MNDQSETMTAVKEIIDNEERLKEMLLRSEITLRNFRQIAVEIAGGLAHAGNSPHKEKNEAILTAISRLLALSTNYPVKQDEIPF